MWFIGLPFGGGDGGDGDDGGRQDSFSTLDSHFSLLRPPFWMREFKTGCNKSYLSCLVKVNPNIIDLKKYQKRDRQRCNFQKKFVFSFLAILNFSYIRFIMSDWPPDVKLARRNVFAVSLLPLHIKREGTVEKKRASWQLQFYSVWLAHGF